MSQAMKTTPDSLIFDLDGTLWDTCPSCAIGWNNVLKRHAIDFREITADDVRAVCGRSHEDCIRTVFSGLPERHLQILINETSEEDNRIIAEQGGELYEGVASGLARLSERYPLFIVSNCQKGYIETFMRWSGLVKHFKDYECWGNTGQPKFANIKAVIERNALEAPVYIGDTEGDRLAAHAAKVPFVHVTYGFGSCAASADHVATSFGELEKLFLH